MTDTNKDNENHFFGPLTLHQKSEKSSIFKDNVITKISCVLCAENFVIPESEKQLLTHLFMEHRLVIADVNQIANLNEYMRYWRLRFKDHDLPYFCTTMLMDKKPDGTESKDEEYFLLSDVLPEDKELRSNLKEKKLTDFLERHQFEREDKGFIRECLFCRHISTTTRAFYLNHLYDKHNFHIAKPENLIFIDDLIDFIASKLENLQCIYCEGKFKDRTILKEHMRKKGHKRINADNKEYDKFFLVNYIGDKQINQKQIRKPYRKLNPRPRKSSNDNDSADSDPDWSEWKEDNGPLITCLLCDFTGMEFENMLDHMEKKHEYSFTEATNGLSFYLRVKLVNYIRRQILLKQCLSCDTKFEDSKNLEKHLKETKHFNVSKDRFDQPEYYFPTYEDDLFLCFIHDEDESWWSGDETETENRNSMSDSISKEMAMAVLND